MATQACVELEHYCGFGGHHLGVVHYHPVKAETLIYAAAAAIIIEDVNDPHKQEFLRGHDAEVCAIDISLNGKLLASGLIGSASRKGAVAPVMVWDFDNRARYMEFNGIAHSVLCVRFSPDGRFLVATGANQTIFVLMAGFASKKSIAGLYSWKAAVYGVTWVPIAGGAISLALGVVTAATEATTKQVEQQLQTQRESQKLLCGKGKDASLPYFSDVTFGMLLEQYQKVREATEEAVRMQQNKTLDSAMVGTAGDSAAKANEVLSSNAAKATKALLHAGLFIGGFFSFGITWIVGGGLGAAELMAEWSATYAAATSLSMKTFLLTALARQLDESTWASNTTVCYVTDVDRDEDPCPPVMRPDGSGKVNRVCSRSSPWNHHLKHIPNAELSPEGRCLPRANVALGNGLPCLTHEACTSGYCHFEPMLQYFFSDHKRGPCPKKIGGSQSCTNVFDQLLALQVSSVQAQMKNYTQNETDLLWNVHPENFTDTYTGSFQGPVYATTGTCATACPKEQVGKGTCAGISVGGTDLDKRIPFLGRFEFGVRQSNRIFSGHLSFELVGNGICGALADNIAGDDDQIKNEPYEAKQRVVIETANSLGELLQACADYCKTDASFVCESFSARILPEEDGMVCDLYDQVADTAHETGDSSCYTITEAWPLDVYQPWNIEWSFYLMKLRSVMKALLSSSKAEESLKAVRKAYPGYCKDNVLFKTLQHCHPPKDWTDWDAVNVLRFGAPLSFHQLQALHEEIFPGSTEKIAVSGDQIKVLDLIKRPHGFGMAWRSYLGESAISKAWDVEYTKAPSMRDKVWVQRVEVRAFQYKMRTHDGLWDLGAAVRHLTLEEAQSVKPEEIQKVEMQKMMKKRKQRSLKKATTEVNVNSSFHY